MTSRAPRPIPPDLPVELAVPVLDAIALTALERRLRDAATTVDGIRAGLRRVELREWRGSAADAFRDRLDACRAGASSVYGSDAVAGVVLIVWRSRMTQASKEKP